MQSHLFHLLVAFFTPLSHVSAAPPLRDGFAQDLYQPSHPTPNTTASSSPLNFPQPNVKSKIYHVPHTPITLLYTPETSYPILIQVLSGMLNDALAQVLSRINIYSSTTVLPSYQDPYIYDDLAGRAPRGGYFLVQSPDEGPAHGRRLTWGNVRDVLVGLQEVMLKRWRTMSFGLEFWVRWEELGMIGWGQVRPGSVPESFGGGGGVDWRK